MLFTTFPDTVESLSGLRETRLLHIMALLAFMMASTPHLPLLAQGLDREEAVESIIGSDVITEETDAQAMRPERIVSLIESVLQAADEVRKTFRLDEVTIVFLGEMAEEEPAIAEAIGAHGEAIAALRRAIQSSAMFYHAIDSRSIVLDDVVAVEFVDGGIASIYVNGREPGGG